LRNSPNDVLEEISRKKTYLPIRKGEKLLSEDDKARDIFFIHSGVAKFEVNGKSDRTLIMKLAGKGAVLGHRSSSRNDSLPQTVVAVENLKVCKLSIEDFRSIAGKSPNLQSEITDSYLQEMREMELRALELVHKSVRQRIAGILIEIAALYQYAPGIKTVRTSLSRQDLAALAGTTKEQVSTILAEFQKQKLVKYQAKHFKYFNLAELRKIAEMVSLNQNSQD